MIWNLLLFENFIKTVMKLECQWWNDKNIWNSLLRIHYIHWIKMQSCLWNIHETKCLRICNPTVMIVNAFRCMNVDSSHADVTTLWFWVKIKIWRTLEQISISLPIISFHSNEIGLSLLCSVVGLIPAPEIDFWFSLGKITFEENVLLIWYKLVSLLQYPFATSEGCHP